MNNAAEDGCTVVFIAVMIVPPGILLPFDFIYLFCPGGGVSLGHG